MDSDEDTRLVAGAVSGDPEAFGPIIERYKDAVFGVALARLGDFDDAEDVAQEVFLDAFQRLGRLRDPSRLGAWLRSMTIHRSVDLLRKRRDHTDVDEVADLVPDASTPHEQVEAGELREQVLAAIRRLSKVLCAEAPSEPSRTSRSPGWFVGLAGSQSRALSHLVRFPHELLSE